MSSVLYRLGKACYHARFRVLALWAVILVVMGAAAFTLGGKFTDTFSIPGASSQVAFQRLQATFPGAGDATATGIVVAPPGKKMTDPAVRGAVEKWMAELEQERLVDTVTTPYNDFITGLISADGTTAIVRMSVTGDIISWTDADREELTQAVQRLESQLPGAQASVGGDVFSVSVPGLTPIEFLGVGVAAIVLVLTLGSVVAAGMPLGVALVSAGLGALTILLAAAFMDVNSTTLLLAVMLGIAVGIDYSLLIVSRHRDQLARGDIGAQESAGRAVATAGSAVVFAGMTVIIALVGLFVANIPFLTVMGMFSAVTVAFAVVMALTLLPAFLGIAGDRLRPKARSGPPRPARAEAAASWWIKVVTKVPLVTVLICVVGLGALAWPAKDLTMALPSAGQNPVGTASRTTYDLVSEKFGPGANGPLIITGSIVESNDPLGLVSDMKAEVERIPGVASVPLATPNQNADSMMIQVVPTTGPDDPATTALVEELRSRAGAWKDTYGVETFVTGVTAVQIDVSNRLADALLPFGIFVVGLSLVLLTLVFRSIWVPVKASLGYLLSVGAAFGASTLVFNQGWFKGLVNLAEPGPIISFFPIMLMGVLFGLAMDYEVFLVSRMREEFVHGNLTDSVRVGFVHSAKVVVAAALIMFSVFAFFVPEGEGPIKSVAFGLAVGVAIDAFVVRMTLVPAVMTLLGNHAWWLPKWLDKRLPVMDIEGEGLAHQLRLQGWDAAEGRVIHASGLGAEADGVVLFSGVDVSVEPGSAVVVTGSPAARTALLLVLTGRALASSGDAKVLGLVLPEQAGEVRGLSELVLAAGPGAGRLLSRSQAELIAVDAVDNLSAADRAALAARMEATPQITWLLGALPGADLSDLPPARYHEVNLPLDRTLVGVTNK